MIGQNELSVHTILPSTVSDRVHAATVREDLTAYLPKERNGLTWISEFWWWTMTCRSAAVLRASLSAARYEVDTAASGEESLEMMKDRKYHLVLLDLSMPGVDGLELCRTLRATSEAEIIIISVRSIEQRYCCWTGCGGRRLHHQTFSHAGTPGEDSFRTPPECCFDGIGPPQAHPGGNRN
jgi:CheY-like chemotaxis protein